MVTDCRPAPGVTEEELLCVAASLEKPSEHPLADAITAEAQARNIPLAPVEDFLATPGRGIRGVIQGQRLLAGNRAMLEEAGVPLDGFDAVAEGLAQAGKTPLYFAGDGRMLGVVAVADTLSPPAQRLSAPSRPWASTWSCSPATTPAPPPPSALRPGSTPWWPGCSGMARRP